MKNETPVRQKILIVDDEPANIKVLGEMLMYNYQISIAGSGPEAIQLARSNLPDLILLDIVMPDIDGYAVCKQLKEEESTSKIPVIFITAKNAEEDEKKGFDLGAVDYITKPFSLSVVQARVKTHLELKRHRDFLEWLLKERTNELEDTRREYMHLFLRGSTLEDMDKDDSRKGQ
ncbi:MAG TPA: response regulator [Deltaproteobacteria bacterium]|nr:response regulator [Deltaproteobacteria bacterium]